MKIPSIRHRSMRSLSGLTAVALGLFLICLAVTASAQDRGTAKIDFPFVYGTHQLPAGTYAIEADPMQGTVRLASKDAKNATVTMIVITRLGRHDNDPDTELVFDKVKDKLVLSEIWLANNDGYLVTNTPGNHEHLVLGGSHPHK
jgi:hypothetical protein